MQLLCLNCFIDGDKSNETFTVKIPKTENVSILKDSIKEKKSHCLFLMYKQGPLKDYIQATEQR
jgi:hypothetical protein